MAIPGWLHLAWRNAGASLVGPLLLVGATGVVVLLGYNSNPDVANERLREAPAWFDAARSLHLWSSRALLAGSAIHVAWVWYDGRVAGAHRHAYLMGALLLGLLSLEHLTGHALRWDPAARALADYQRALLPAGLQGGVEGLQLPAHVGLLGGLTLVVSLLHVGLVGGGTHTRVLPAFPGGRRRARTPLVAGSILSVAAIALVSLLAPAPARQATVPWPMAPFDDLSRWTGSAVLFGAAAMAAWLLVVLQPAMVRRRWLACAARVALAVLFFASLWPRP